jgi:hypothetical protein
VVGPVGGDLKTMGIAQAVADALMALPA